MVNCGSMTFVLRTKRVYPALASHESIRYWNAGWFYVKNIPVPGVHDGLPAFVNKAPEELASWSLIPALAQYPELDKMARRISWLVHGGLTGMDLTLSWFTRRIQPLKYNKPLICEYSGVDDQLRVTKDNLPMDSLNKRIWTLMKFARGQEVPYINKDIFINNKCPPLNSFAEDSFKDVFRLPVAGMAEEDPEDDDEEEEQAPKKKAAPHVPKRPRAKVSSTDAGTIGEASAKKARTRAPPRLDSKKAERDRIKLLATAGKGSRPLLPGATNQKVTASRASTQKHITSFLKTSPAVGPVTPAPPSASNPAPQPSPPEAHPAPDPAADTQVEIIPVSSVKKGGSCSETRQAAPENAQDKGPEEAEVTSTDKVEASAKDAVGFPANFGDPSDLYATPKAYYHKFFNKLTEAEKWELEQDLLNSMLNNAWGKVDVESSEIQNHKREISEFFDQLFVKRKEQQALHYKLHKNISLQRRVTLGQADQIHDAKEKIAELERLLAEAQGVSTSLATASSELKSLHSAHKDLESKLKEADEKWELAEKQLTEKNSQFIRETTDLVEKRRKDSATLKSLQQNVQHLQT
ncbi:hypothetical protein QYE76_037991 [Lolium multiflorum]|uniref:Uncharacterized protein n=1 Tax=Lolium multiflorum TaxID=4521 RepID=A0AAD8T806_LOLMU|nr:hypothetical protein QYE76_037991 [Lolium multiflorum]